MATKKSKAKKAPATKPRKSASTKPAKPAKPAGRRKTTGSSVLVRMYNVGFGDAFLIEFPGGPDGVQRVLVDCGSIANPDGHKLEDVVGRIIEDSGGPDKARIDLVIATHRHRDHVEGFTDPRWNDVAVREVWMPWTEDPKDPKATEIRETQAGMAKALAATLKNRPGADANPWLGLALNALTNDVAMSMLHRGFDGKAKRRFLSVSDKGTAPVDSTVLENVTVHVLGPSRDPDIIRDMDPPKGKSFLTQLGEGGTAHEAIDPFDESFWLHPEELRGPEMEPLVVDPKDAAYIAEQSLESDSAIAVALESAVNGTSLVLLFECGDAYLLFAGDAQWGTWNRMLQDRDAQQLLKRVNFFKVGHHGSHNATPIEFIQDYFPVNCCSMVSTLVTKRWKNIPRKPLIDGILKKSKIFARSDKPGEADPLQFTAFQQTYIERRVKC